MIGERRGDDGTEEQDPDRLEWWTNLPGLVARLERMLAVTAKALKAAQKELARLEKGRVANRRFIKELVAGAIIFNVAVMLLFGWLWDQRDEQRAEDIANVRRQFYRQCVDINANAKTINGFLDAQIMLVRTSPVKRTDEEKQRLIDNYNTLRQQEPKCVPPDENLETP